MAANAKQQLELLKKSVQQHFCELQAALHMREKLLMRQIDVIANTQQHTANNETKKIEFLVEQEDELLAAIRSFGRFQLDNMNHLALQDVYLKNEDYIVPSNDHETMYKSCVDTTTTADEFDNIELEQPEAIVVDFSRNKSLIEHNTRHMNESIINITLQEAKELITKAKTKRETPIPPLNLEELDDELESSIAEAVSSLERESPANTKSSQTAAEANAAKKSKKQRFKPKITINNCNGTINLRNISSLTINCATEESVSAEIPLQQTADIAEQQQEQSTECDEADNSTQYLKFAKSTIKLNNKHCKNAAVESSSTDNSTNTTASSSNYSSNSSSRSQSKKTSKGASKKMQNKKYETSSSVATSAVSDIATPTPQPTSTTGTNATAAYIVDDDVDEDDAADYDEATTAVTCDFYNRLLNEIKNSLKEKSKRRIDNTHYLVSSSTNTGSGAHAVAADSTCDINSNGTGTVVSSSSNSNNNNHSSISTNTNSAGVGGTKRLILKNFENLKIILEANSDEETFHPVQIEQWLAEIISETDQEPMQSTDILEHSKLHNESA